MLAALVLYAVVAKVAGTFDRPVCAFGQVISGHMLKPLIAAAALRWP